MPANLSVQGWVSRALAKARASLDGGPSDGTGPRMSRYQEQMTGAAWVGEYALCDEGCLMMASMLPGATALQVGIVTANTTSTAGMLVFANNAPAGPSSPRCHLREIHLVYTAPATNNVITSVQYSTVLDTVNRAPSTIAAGVGSPAANAAYAPAPVCTNMDETPTIVGKPYFPLSTSAAAGVLIPAQGASARVLVGNGILRANNPNTFDDYRIVFGATDRVRSTGSTPGSTTVGVFTELHPAVTVGPQEYFVLSVAFPAAASSGPTLTQLDMSWIER